MIYHFVKNVGFDIKANSLEQAKEIANVIDKANQFGHNRIEDSAYDVMFDAIDYVSTSDDEYSRLSNESNAHAGCSEYVGYTEDSDDEDFESEEDFYKYLTDDCDGDCDHCEYGSSNKEEDVVSFLAEIILKSLLG